MSSMFCETSSRVHLKFKASSSFNFEDIIKKSLPDGSIILKNRQQSAKKSSRLDNMLVVAKFASQPLPAVGMLNTANNCYINASLQVLLRMPVFGATITRLEHNHCEMSFCMINFLKMVLRKLSRGERVPISMLLENIRAINKDFRRGQQEDAHEMILSTLEYIRNDLRCGRRTNPPPEVAWVFQNIERTLFTKFKQSIRCAACANISVTTTSDAFVVVGCGDSLEMALRAHFATEVLEGECAYHCDHCRAKQRATKRLAIDRPGEYFAVQLSRFHYDGYKNSSYVPFPETINLTEFTENPNGPANTYALFAAIIHEGDSTRSGHYLSIVKVNNKYKIFNDLDVDDTSWREVKHTRPYIIIYAKVHRQLICPAGLLKRKLEVADSDQPLTKKAFSAFGPLQSASRSNGETSKPASTAPRLVWHRPATPRKAQVILSQEPPQEIQNIAVKEGSFRVQKHLTKNNWDGASSNGFHRADSYLHKTQDFVKTVNNQRKPDILPRSGSYPPKSMDFVKSNNQRKLDSLNRPDVYPPKSQDYLKINNQRKKETLLRTDSYQTKSSGALNRSESYPSKPSTAYSGKSHDSVRQSDNYQRKSYDGLNRSNSYPRKSYDSVNRGPKYQRKPDSVRRIDNYQAKYVSVRPLQRQKENDVRVSSHHIVYQNSFKAPNGYTDSQYASCGKNGYNNGHNGYHNFHHNYHFNHNPSLSKTSKPLIGNNGFHNNYKYNGVLNPTKEGQINGKSFYKAYPRRHQ